MIGCFPAIKTTISRKLDLIIDKVQKKEVLKKELL